jgi:ActR/RegA family two-component response regulator
MQYILSDTEYDALILRATKAEEELAKFKEQAVFIVPTIVPLDEVKANYAKVVVDRCKGNISEAADILGVHRHTVTMMVKDTNP